ncbi:MAG: hypothetical protein KBA26_07385 [Candidatus Delongbacteria bacterium]|nr:hypothetical protein [Candidatus Delongbacteria bacterium]
MKASLELFHPCEWIMITDVFSANALSAFPNVFIFQILDCVDGHHLDKEKQENFIQIVSHKVTVCMESIREYGYAFLLDCDLLFLHSIQSLLNGFLASQDDIMVSSQAGRFSILKDHVLDYTGKYNSGMVLTKNMLLLEDWKRKIEERKYFVDQKPLEIVINNGQYRTVIFPETCNIGAWKYSLLDRIECRDDGLYLDEEPIVNFHLHLLSDTPFWHKIENTFRSRVIMLLSQTPNEHYRFLLNYLLKVWFKNPDRVSGCEAYPKIS